jgi:hypothetical protein
MKNFRTLFLLICSVVFIISSSSFGGGKKIKTMLDGILQIPKASYAPTIDGLLDGEWNMVTAYPMVLTEGVEDTVISYDDHAAYFRAMWDEDNFYVFVETVDDTLKREIDKSSPWLNDCVEIFFDGGNEKASSYDANDVQWRWVLNELPSDTGKAGNGPGNWAWHETASGYNFELAISKDTLASRFPLEADQEIGFEISNGDLETPASPQTVLHWWTYVATTWNDPSLFGTADLVDKEVSDILEIQYADDTPTIDGDMTSGEGWEAADELSFTKFEGNTDEYPRDSTLLTWKDHTASFWTLWDENNFYVFVQVIDDTLKTVIDKSSPWLNDCIEIFFDGGNEKASSYDANDIQWRWVLDEMPSDTGKAGNGPGNWAWKHTADGYNFELAISKDTLASRFPLINDQEIGFEISNGDLETPSSPQRVLHWWTNVATTWNDPTLFGTADLVNGPAVGVEDENQLVTDYRLEQNYPNPFNPSTKISYTIKTSEKVKLSVYNILGKQVALLVNGLKNPGNHTVEFRAENLPSGVYFYRLETANKQLTKKMILLK